MKKHEIKNMSVSVKKRLLNISKQNKEDYNLTLTYYAIERLLYRLGKSKHSKNFILKGALIFRIWNDELYRSTRDIDFLSYNTPSISLLISIFKEICSLEVEDDGIIFDSNNITAMAIRENNIHQGIRLKIISKIEKAIVKLQIDIGFGDSITPAPKKTNYPHILDFNSPIIFVYPLETVFAEKLEALISMGIYTSRMKDIYDLFILIKKIDINKDAIKKAILNTFKTRKTPIPKTVPTVLSNTFIIDKDKNIQWKSFIKKIGGNPVILSLKIVIIEIRKYIIDHLKLIKNK